MKLKQKDSFSTKKQPKTLYISDLDGTLLNKDAELSGYAVDRLNSMIEGGLCFTIATARTAATALSILKDLNLKLPLILMNGSLVYCTEERRYIKKALLNKETVESIIPIMNASGVGGLMYTLTDEDELVVYYDQPDNAILEAFMEERRRKYLKNSHM